MSGFDWKLPTDIQERDDKRKHNFTKSLQDEGNSVHGKSLKKAAENKRKNIEFWRKQSDIRNGKVDLHPEVKPRDENQPLNITKHNPNESREARRKRIKEARSNAISKALDKNR